MVNCGKQIVVRNRKGELQPMDQECAIHAYTS